MMLQELDTTDRLNGTEMNWQCYALNHVPTGFMLTA